MRFLHFREMKKDYCNERDDGGGGGLLANPDLALQVSKLLIQI